MVETIILEALETTPKLGMELHIVVVPLNMVAQTWGDAEQFIKDGLDKGQDGFEDYTIDQVKAMLMQGYWYLAVAYDDTGKIHGAAAVEMINRANDRVAFIVSIGGRLVANNKTFAQLVVSMKSLGATMIEGAARESIARLWRRFGFKTKYAVVGVRV